MPRPIPLAHLLVATAAVGAAVLAASPAHADPVEPAPPVVDAVPSPAPNPAPLPIPNGVTRPVYDTIGDAFGRAVGEVGVTAPNMADPASALALGQSMCPMLSQPGHPAADVASAIAGSTGMPLGATSMFAGMAGSTLCGGVVDRVANGQSALQNGLPTLGALMAPAPAAPAPAVDAPAPPPVLPG